MFLVGNNTGVTYKFRSEVTSVGQWFLKEYDYPAVIPEY